MLGIVDLVTPTIADTVWITAIDHVGGEGVIVHAGCFRVDAGVFAKDSALLVWRVLTGRFAAQRNRRRHVGTSWKRPSNRGVAEA